MEVYVIKAVCEKLDGLFCHYPGIHKEKKATLKSLHEK